MSIAPPSRDDTPYGARRDDTDADAYRRDDTDADAYRRDDTDADAYRRDDTPVGIVRPIQRGEIASLDDLVDLEGRSSPSRHARPPRRGRRRGRKPVRRARIVFRVVLLLVVAAVAYYGITFFQVWSTGRSDQARQVDAIVVMGAAQYDGTPSPQLAARLDHAAGLYQQGLAPIVVVTGGKQPNDRFTEAEASAQYLGERGVPDASILLENNGHTTYESLDAVADILSERGLHSVLIVTDPFHSLRSRLIAQRAGLEAYVSPTPTSVVTGSGELKRELVEAAGISVGRIIGFDRF